MLNRPEGDDERFRLPSRVDTVAALVRGQVQFAVVVTLAAAWLVPVASIRPEDDDDAVERLSLTSLLGRAGDLIGASDDAHPFSRGWGAWLVVVGAILVLTATLALAWLVVTAIDDTARLRRGLVTAVLLVGLGWFPDFDDDVLGTVELGPSWGLWPPAAAALGVLLSHRSLIDLNEIDRPR